MRFLVDTQLPARLAEFLSEVGHDVVRTSVLPDGNRTTDARIAEQTDRDGRVVVTKDRDFRDGHLLTGVAAAAAAGGLDWQHHERRAAVAVRNLDAIAGALADALIHLRVTGRVSPLRCAQRSLRPT